MSRGTRTCIIPGTWHATHCTQATAENTSNQTWLGTIASTVHTTASRPSTAPGLDLVKRISTWSYTLYGLGWSSPWTPVLPSEIRLPSNTMPCHYLNSGNYQSFLRILEGNTITLAHSDKPYTQEIWEIGETRFHELRTRKSVSFFPLTTMMMALTTMFSHSVLKSSPCVTKSRTLGTGAQIFSVRGHTVFNSREYI